MTADIDSLRGWELNNPDPHLFDRKVLTIFGNCTECTSLSGCPSPCESVRQLAPKKGELIGLGCDISSEEESICYFAWIHEKESKYILLREPKYLWARASYVAERQVPEWARSRFAQEVNASGQ